MQLLKIGILGLLLVFSSCNWFKSSENKTKEIKDLRSINRSSSFVSSKPMITVTGSENYYGVEVTVSYDFPRYIETVNNNNKNMLSSSDNSSKFTELMYCLNVKRYAATSFQIWNNLDLTEAEDFDCSEGDWKTYEEVVREIYIPWAELVIMNIKAKTLLGEEVVYQRLFLNHYMEYIDFILSCDELVNFYLTTNAAIVLTQDIDCSGQDFMSVTTSTRSGLYILGNGYVIKNINIEAGFYAGGVGILGKLKDNSYISNLGIEGVSISSEGWETGGLTGDLLNSSLENVYIKDVEVTGLNSSGGLVGYASNGLIIDGGAYNVSVSGNNFVGGLVGEVQGGTRIIGSTSSGTVSGINNGQGGLIGAMVGSSVEGSVTNIDVEGSHNVGGLIGTAIDSTVSYSSSSGIVHGLDYNDVYADGTGGLVGSAINTSITYSSSSSTVSAEYGSHNTGGLVGFMNEFSHVDYSSASGAVSSLYNSAGGLIGYLYNDSYDEQTYNVSNSHANGSVTGRFIVGGLIGRADATIIEKVYATGKVTSNYEDSSGHAGGLIGFFVDAELYDSYATGHVEACTLSTKVCDSVGGLIGYMSGDIYDPKIFNSYALGSVLGTEIIGSLVGLLTGTATFHGGYATGTVTGSGQYVGGVFGYRSPYADVENVYSLYPDTSAGVTVLTEAEFGEEASFIGFDFSSGWVMQSRMRCIDIRRPHLYWEPPYNSRFACAVMD